MHISLLTQSRGQVTRQTYVGMKEPKIVTSPMRKWGVEEKSCEKRAKEIGQQLGRKITFTCEIDSTKLLKANRRVHRLAQ